MSSIDEQSERYKHFGERFRQILADITADETNPTLAQARSEMITTTNTALSLALQFRPSNEVEPAVERMKQATERFGVVLRTFIEPATVIIIGQIWAEYRSVGSPFGDDIGGLEKWLNESEQTLPSAKDAVTWVEDFLRTSRPDTPPT